MRPLLYCLLLSGCALDLGLGSDPYGNLENDPCQVGNIRDGDTACVVPTSHVVVNGDVSEWTTVPAIAETAPCTAEPCVGLTVTQFQVGRTSASTDTFLVVHVTTDAAPVATDPDIAYVIDFESLEIPYHDATAQLVSATDGVHFKLSNVDVSPPAGMTRPYAFAYAPDGFEAAIPVHYLPFADGVAVRFFATRAGVPVSDPTWLAACWSTDDRVLDPCGGWW